MEKPWRWVGGLGWVMEGGVSVWAVGGWLWGLDRRKGSVKKDGVMKGGTQVSERHEGVRERLSLKEVVSSWREAYKTRRTGKA